VTAIVDPYQALTGRNGPFPLAEQTVEGRRLQVLDRAPHTLVEAFLSTRDHGDAEALVYRDERYTYRQQWQLVMAAARSLRARFAIGPGERVAVAMRNYPEWVFAFWALELLGAVVVPLNAWSTGGELKELLAESGSTLLIADAERVDKLAAEPEGLSGLKGVVIVRGRRPDAVPFTELVADLGGPDLDDHLPIPEELATILYTSGTTGRPKGVLSTHRNHTATILIMRLRAEAVRRARVSTAGSQAGGGVIPAAHAPGTTLITTPLFHIAALTILTSNAYAGRRVVLLYKWDVEEALRIIAREQVSELSGPPLVVRELVDAVAAGGHDTSSLISLVAGAAPAPPQLVRDIGTVFGGQVSPGTGYGSTETTSTVLTITGADFLARPTSVGRPLPTVEIRVRDEHGNAVLPGGIGELQVRGPQIARGYDRSPAETATAFVDGWYRTGDQVTLDEDGFVHLVGRLKDIVIRGGENVHCAEVERALYEHPDILEAAVIGRPHATLGEEVAAVIRLRPGRSLDGPAVAALLRARLAPFKIPTSFRFTLEPLPRTATGKILKAELADGVDGVDGVDGALWT
jgi:long-chain acyl-CoA synthetase